MAKNQAKQETEDNEPWIAEDPVDFDEASNDASRPVKTRTDMRHKIEELLESRRLKQQIADYEAFDIDERKPLQRLH